MLCAEANIGDDSRKNRFDGF